MIWHQTNPFRFLVAFLWLPVQSDGCCSVRSWGSWGSATGRCPTRSLPCWRRLSRTTTGNSFSQGNLSPPKMLILFLVLKRGILSNPPPPLVWVSTLLVFGVAEDCHGQWSFLLVICLSVPRYSGWHWKLWRPKKCHISIMSEPFHWANLVRIKPINPWSDENQWIHAFNLMWTWKSILKFNKFCGAWNWRNGW